MKQKVFYDPSTGFNAKATSKKAAWQLIHAECVRCGHHPPLLNQVYEAVPMYLWELFVRILWNDGLTNVNASRIYSEAYQEFEDFCEWAMAEFACTELPAKQLYRECMRTREEW